jgi:hypothetical protein
MWFFGEVAVVILYSVHCIHAVGAAAEIYIFLMNIGVFPELDHILARRFLHKVILMPANQHRNYQCNGVSKYTDN